MLRRKTARAIILHNDQLLLIERWRDNLHYFSVPGGGIEPNETPEQTVVREIAEETGCVIRPGRHVYTLQLADGTEHYFFLAEYVSGEPHLPADSPEALVYAAGNRFKPQWISVNGMNQINFLVWAPIKDQLMHDLQYGFPGAPQILATNG